MIQVIQKNIKLIRGSEKPLYRKKIMERLKQALEDYDSEPRLLSMFDGDTLRTSAELHTEMMEINARQLQTLNAYLDADYKVGGSSQKNHPSRKLNRMSKSKTIRNRINYKNL